jgi:hypothetical protein
MHANHDDNSLSADLNVGHIKLTTYISATLRRIQDKYRICYYININGDYDIVLKVADIYVVSLICPTFKSADKLLSS